MSLFNKKTKVDGFAEKVREAYDHEKLSDQDKDTIVSYIKTGYLEFIKTLLRQRNINPVKFEGVADRLRAEFTSSSEYKKQQQKNKQ